MPPHFAPQDSSVRQTGRSLDSAVGDGEAQSGTAPAQKHVAVRVWGRGQ